MICDLLATTLGERVGISPVNVHWTWQISDLTSGIPQVSESSEHLWATTISWRASSRTVGRGVDIVGRHPINTRLAKLEAGVPLVCRALMSSLVARGSTTTVWICAWARFWDGSFVREDPRKPDAGRDGTQHHHSTNEDKRSRFKFHRKNGARCILGLMG